MRRYCAANGLTRLWTLTYRGDGCHDLDELKAHVGLFFRDLRSALGGRPLPYLWVPEWHPGGHGLHVHFGAGRFIRRTLVEQAWGRGFVKGKLLTDLPVGATTWHEARRTAGYLSKYVSKTFASPSVFGRHRYEVAQGFQPQQVRLTGRSSDAVLAQACELMGGQPAMRWSSSENEEWQGPPAVWFAWD